MRKVLVSSVIVTGLMVMAVTLIFIGMNMRVSNNHDDKPAKNYSIRLTIENPRLQKNTDLFGTVILINDTDEDLFIESRGDARQYLEFKVYDDANVNISPEGYGRAFVTLVGETVTHTIKRRSQWSANAVPNAMIDMSTIKIGTYRIIAEYNYREIRLKSNPVLVTIVE